MHAHQARAMQAYRGAVGAALRWYAFSRALQRQQVVVDRAVRMYGHRVIASTQRAVLQTWSAVAQSVRGRRREAAAVFCQCFLIVHRRAALALAFRTWVHYLHRALDAANKAAVARLADDLEQVRPLNWAKLW